MYGHTSGYRVEDCESTNVPWFNAETQQWCKAKDVESLEALVLQYTSILSALRTEVLQLRLDRQCEHDLRVKLAGELEHATCHIESLQAELTDANVEVWKARVRAS